MAEIGKTSRRGLLSRFALCGVVTLTAMGPTRGLAQFGGLTDLFGSVLGSLDQLIGRLNQVLEVAADLDIEFADARLLLDGFARLQQILEQAQGLGWQIERVLDQFDEIFTLADAGDWFAALDHSRAALAQIREAARTAVQISTRIHEDLQSRALYAGLLTEINKEPNIAIAAAPLLNNEWNSLLFERLGHVTTLLGTTQRLIASEQAAIASAQERGQLQREAFLGQTMRQPLPQLNGDATFGLQLP